MYNEIRKRKIAINYADNKYKKEQKYNTKTAYKVGNFDEVIEYGPNDIDKQFFEENASILLQKRGGGYWLWKPYIISKALKRINTGEYLFYCDSGVSYIDSIDKLIKCFELYNQDIMLFDLPLLEKNWTKLINFEIMQCSGEKYTETNQRLASFILIRKSDFSIKFIEEYLKYSCNEILITDLHSVGEETFIEHRHDQSILSLLSKMYNLKSFRDPSQYGFHPELYYNNVINMLVSKGIKVDRKDYIAIKSYDYCDYPQILKHYRTEKKIKTMIINKVRKFKKLIKGND